MKLTLLFLIPFSLFLTPILAQTEKPAYAGAVIYTSGGFDGYNYPMKGDSVLVFIKDNKEISFTVFPKSDIKNLRHFDIQFKDLLLMGKKEYGNIVAPDKTVPTGNYDMNFSYKPDPKSFTFYHVNLTHFGDGTTADLTVISEDGDQIRLNDLMIANLTKLK